MRNFASEEEREEGERGGEKRKGGASRSPLLCTAATRAPAPPMRVSRKAQVSRGRRRHPYQNLLVPFPDPKGSPLRDRGQGHRRQSRFITMTVTPPPRRASRHGSREATSLSRAPAPIAPAVTWIARKTQTPLDPRKDPEGLLRGRGNGRRERESPVGREQGQKYDNLPPLMRRRICTKQWSGAAFKP